jgi:hypothetical protein
LVINKGNVTLYGLNWMGKTRRIRENYAGKKLPRKLNGN